MKSTILKKSSAVILTVVILFTTVFSLSIFANAATAFTPRLSAPSSTNKYYYSDINIYYKYGWGMPNCTAYAYGRAYELLGTEPKLCPYNAEEWYDYNKNNGYYSYGSSPKLGAIACWAYNGGGGHVAVVEKIENNTITFSNSAYSGTNFYLSYADTSDDNAGGASWWNFQGYIYIGDFTTADKTYTTGVYETDVEDNLNMRSGAGTRYSYVTSVPDGVQLSVTEVKSADGYHWGYTTYNGKNGWVALEFCKYISALPETQPTTVAPTTTQPVTTVPVTTIAPTTKQPTTAQPTTTVPVTQATTQPATTKPNGIGIGDANMDGKISILDATLIQKYVAELTELTDEQLSYGDFNFDGRVSIMDSTSIQKYIAY